MLIVIPTLLSAILFLLAATHGTLALKVTWPPDAAQCDMVDVSWNEGVAPYTIWIHPIGGLSSWTDFQQNITSARVPLRLCAGTRYIAAITDGTDAYKFLSFGSSEITTVQPSSNTSCLDLQIAADYSFAVSGTPAQCTTGFRISWLDKTSTGPYTFTPFPLDQSFRPFDVAMGSNASGTLDWTANLPEGTRFSIMMNSQNGHARAGIGGIHEVSPGSSSSCLTQTSNPTGAWPSDIPIGNMSPTSSVTYDISVIPSGTASGSIAISGSASATSSRGGDGSSSNGASTAAIAGGAAGGVAVLALLLVGWFIWSRRRKRKQKAAAEGNLIDLYEDHNAGRGSGGARSPEVGQVYHPVTPFVGGTTKGSRRLGAGAGAGEGVRGGGYDPAGTGRLRDDDASATRGRGAGQSNFGPDWVLLPSGGARLHPPSPSSPALATPTSGIERDLKRPLLRPGQVSTGSLGTGTSPPGRGDVSFLRHEDGGSAMYEERVELPPLYAQVPREGRRRSGGGAGAVGSPAEG